MRAVPLANVAEWGSGGTPPRGVTEYFGEGVPWLSIADLTDGPVFGAKESLTQLGIASSSAKIVPPGTILIAMYGSIGKLGIAETEVCTSQAIAFALPKREVIDGSYLFHFLHSQRPQLQAMGRGGTQMNIGQADLKALQVPLPSMSEQKRIAAILDQADAVRAKRRQVLAHLDSLSRSILRDMFGDPGEWPDRWTMATIGDAAASVQYGTSAKAGAVGAWPILRMGNITDWGRIDSTDLKYLDLADADISKYTVRRGDLLFNRTNSAEKVGKAAVVRDETSFALAGYLVRVRMRPIADPEFVSAYLGSDHGRAIRRGMAKLAVNQANISASELKKIPIALPPMNLQRRFACLVAKIESERSRIEASLAKDGELFEVLQSRAFSGQL